MKTESKQAIIKYFMKLKNLRKGYMNDSGEKIEDIKPVGARSLISLTKISLAVSRFRMNEYLEEEDVALGYKIYYESSIKNLLKDYGGLEAYAVSTVDIKGTVVTPKNEKTLKAWILQKLSKQKNGEMETQKLVDEIIENYKFPEDKVEELLSKIRLKGDIYNPRNNLTKLM